MSRVIKGKKKEVVEKPKVKPEKVKKEKES